MQRKVQCASGGACPNPGRDENNLGKKGSGGSSGRTGSHRNRRHPWHKDRHPPEPTGTGRCVQLRAALLPPSRPLPRDYLASGWCLGLDHPCPRTGQGRAGEGLCGGPRASVSPGVWSAGSRTGQPALSGKGSALDKRCRERRPLLLPPPHRSPAPPPAASFRRRVSRLLTQPETPVTPRGATGRRPSRRGCPVAAQRLPLHPPPWRVISSSPSRGSPHIPHGR